MQKRFGKNERIGLQKSDGNKGIGLMMPITITSEINPILHCNSLEHYHQIHNVE